MNKTNINSNWSQSSRADQFVYPLNMVQNQFKTYSQVDLAKFDFKRFKNFACVDMMAKSIWMPHDAHRIHCIN